jgi:uncharacterized protein (TIGR03435 family)
MGGMKALQLAGYSAAAVFCFTWVTMRGDLTYTGGPAATGGFVQTTVPVQQQLTGSPGRPCAAADSATDPTNGIRFDAVSIRPVAENHHGGLTNPPNGDGLILENSTLNDLIRWDFDLGNGWDADRIQGTPKWFTTDNYDIRAKVAASDVAAWQKLNETARRLVFREVLLERFRLACHFADEERPVFNLVVAKSGLKIHQSTSEDLKPFEGKIYLSPQIFGVKVYGLGDSTWGFPEITLKLFADNFLSRQSGRIVIDKTDLPGTYTFTLRWVGVYSDAGKSTDDGSTTAPTAPILYTALQEQLGLKLEPAKSLVPVLVIDHIERPSEN